MKLPNILGHETITEAIQQSSPWTSLLAINCHKDTKTFLCSLFAPVCIAQATQATIYPCRSLCQAVQNSCEAKMLSYNYPWPSIFNCSQFPEDNGFCIKPSDQLANHPESIQINTIDTTTIKAETIQPVVRVKSKCHGCSEARLTSLKPVVQAYCTSKIALRGRVSNYALSEFNLNNHPIAVRNNHQAMSSYVEIPRRDRRFFKGRRIVFETAGPFLTEANLKNYFIGRSELDLDASSAVDLYVLSEAQLRLVNAKKRRRLKRNVEKCRCRVLEKLTRGRKFFITANVVRVRKTYVRNVEEKSTEMRRQFDEAFMLKRQDSLVKDRVGFLKKNFRMMVLTGVFGWNTVRPFIEYLENEDMDRSGMCEDLDRTVTEIEQLDAMYF